MWNGDETNRRVAEDVVAVIEVTGGGAKFFSCITEEIVLYFPYTGLREKERSSSLSSTP